MTRLRDWGRWASYQIGRRGAYLLFVALLDTLFGWSLITTPPLPKGLAPDLYLSYSQWAVAWLIVGAVCLWQAFVKVDRLAFSMAVTLKVLWGTVWLISWVLTSTNPRGWVDGVIFIGFGILTGIVSYWPDYHHPGKTEG